MFKKLLFPLCLFLMLCACGKEPAPPETRTSQLFAMDTVIDLSVYTQDETLLTEGNEVLITPGTCGCFPVIRGQSLSSDGHF